MPHAPKVAVAALLPVLAVSVDALSGQTPAASGGVLAGAPAALLVEGGLVPGDDARTRVHRNGFSLQPTTPLAPSPSAPDLQAILGIPGLHVDDFSTGRDDVLVNENGVIDVPVSSWGVLQFSLRQGAVGLPGSRIQQQVAEGQVGGALFSWILPGSNVPQQLIGPVERSHSPQELGLPAGVFDVDGLDVPMLLGLEQAGLATLEPGFAPLIQNPQAIYFTVSHATRHLVPLAWWSFGGQTTLSSGATILRVLRSFQLGPWTTPHVFQPYGNLGLTRDEDIDGLAYDSVRERLLFSVKGTVRDQLLFTDLSTDGPGHVDVTLPGGVTKASGEIGKAQNDDIDAICTLDPTIGSSGSPPPGGDDFGLSCGTPRPGLLGVPQIHASAFRRRVGGQTIYDTWMIGWPPVTGVGPGLGALFISFGNTTDLHSFGPILLRNPASAVPGDPLHFPLDVPNGLTGFNFTFHWFAIDGAFTELAEAWPVKVFL